MPLPANVKVYGQGCRRLARRACILAEATSEGRAHAIVARHDSGFIGRDISTELTLDYTRKVISGGNDQLDASAGVIIFCRDGRVVDIDGHVAPGVREHELVDTREHGQLGPDHGAPTANTDAPPWDSRSAADPAPLQEHGAADTQPMPT